MKMEICAVHDVKARAFSAPFFSVNLQVAVRSFADVANNTSTVINSNAEDFTLYHLGSWDDTSGSFEQFAQPISLGKAANFLKEKM